MVYCIHDPNLASLLAGKEEAMPAPGDGLLVGCFLAIEILLLLSIGALPWRRARELRKPPPTRRAFA